MYKFYTSEYEGEMVTNSISWRDGNKEDNGVWIPKTIFNEDHVETAFVLGNGPSILKYDYALFEGVRASRDFSVSRAPESVGQTYACNLFYQHWTPTFLICFNDDVCTAIKKSNYAEDNIVYSNRRNITKHPNLFHLYPHFEKLFAGPAALRLAAADGHQKVFMLGFDLYDDTKPHIFPETKRSYQPITDYNAVNNKLIEQCKRVFDTYEEVNFFHVIQESQHMNETIVEEWKWCPNLQTIGYQQFYALAHLGHMIADK